MEHRLKLHGEEGKSDYNYSTCGQLPYALSESNDVDGAYLAKRGPVQVHVTPRNEGIRHEGRDGEREVRGHVGRRDGQGQRRSRPEIKFHQNQCQQ